MEGMGKLKATLFKMKAPLGVECRTCGTELIRFGLAGHDRVLCPTCTQKEKAEADKANVERWTKGSLKARAWAYFKDNSVFNNRNLLKSGFKNLDTSEPQMEQAKNKSISFIKAVLNGETPHLILSGMPGRGKSHLATATVRSLIEMSEHDKKVMFVHYATFLDKVKESFDQTDLKLEISKLKHEMMEADILVLDDIGVDLGHIDNPQTAKPWNMEMLNLILEKREDKPLIITTNFDEAQIRKGYGERNFSRMFKHSKGYRLKFDGVSDKRLEM